jgi:hypothetical protein
MRNFQKSAGGRFPERRKKRRLALAAALLLVSAVPTPSVAEAPLFLIEKIHVETERLSPDIILSESLLQEGRTYSEEALRDAVHRIHRLPFVLLAEVSLAKGSERGRYELTITIYEARRWFFQFDANWALKDDVDRFDPRLDSRLESRIGATGDDANGLVGRRFALGKRGLFFASFGAEEGAFALGYQRYNLWNRNILFSLALGGIEEIGNVSVGDSSWAATAQLGIPIVGNHALRLRTRYRRFDTLLFQGDEIESHDTEAEIVWVYNSLDDAVLPRSGLLMEGGLTWSDGHDTRIDLDADGQLLLEIIDEEATGIIASIGRHWPIGARQSASVGLRAFVEDVGRNETRWEAEGRLGHQVFLIRHQDLGQWRELRLETNASWLRQDYPPSSAVPGLLQWDDTWSLETGLVYRNGWGVFRLTLDYTDRGLQ